MDFSVCHRQLRVMKGLVREQLTIDPQGLARNVGERFKRIPAIGRAAQLYNPRTETDTPESAAREAYETGEITRAIEVLNNTGAGGQALSTWYQSERNRLEQPFVTSLPLERAQKVLYYLTNSLPHTNSGYSLRSHSVLKAMQDAGLEVVAVTRMGYPAVVGRFAMAEQEFVDGIEYYRILPAQYPESLEAQQETAITALIEVARKTGAQVLQTTTGFENALIVSRAAMILEIPWVYEMRGEPERTWLSKKPAITQHVSRHSEYFRLARAQELAAAKAAAAVVVLSETSKQSLIERGVSPEKIVIAPNGVEGDLLDKKPDRAELRSELGLPISKIIVGAITAVVDYEGLEFFLQAMTKLGPEFLAIIVGDGQKLSELQSLATSLGIGDRVQFVGKQPHEDIWKWYSALDVMVVPRKDTLVCRTVTPIKTIAAQALGIPVVASDLPALREVTGEVETYVQPEDPVALSLGIKEAMSRSISTRGKQWASQRTWAKIGEVFRNLYLAG